MRQMFHINRWPRPRVKSSLCGALTVLALLCALPLIAGPRDQQWTKVQEAIQKGLPRTAITNLEPIITAAMKEKAYAEAVKAIGQKIALEGNVEGNKPEEKIIRLQAETAKAPKEMVPVLDTLLAHWYWQYFQQNRWRFMQRTATAAEPGKDFTTWDLPRLFAEIDRQFQRALAAEAYLKQTPVATWDDLLVKGTMPDSYRPTLYDFLVYEALQFYTSGEQAGAKAEDAFELPIGDISPDLKSPFAPAVEFISPDPLARPADAARAARLDAMRSSAAGKAYFLYRDLLRFHRNDPAPRPAFAAADLERLSWAWNAAVAGDDKSARYAKALEKFIEENADEPISALALERRARLRQQEGDPAAAHALAKRGAGLFPDSPGGKLCRNLVSEIEAKSVSLATERVWNAPWPNIAVTYRNLGKVHFRAVAGDWDLYLKKRHHRPESLDQNERREILAKAPALEWSEALPPTPDFKQRHAVFTAPDKLQPGFYFILASPDPKFGEAENVIAFADVWVSRLALVTRVRGARCEGFVLDANSGEPVPGAEVFTWHLDPTGNRVQDPKLTTDTDGFFSFKPEAQRSYLLKARHDGQEVASSGDIWAGNAWDPDAAGPTARTLFFTDRAIYRPGQIVQYKGLCIWLDPTRDNYEVIKAEEVTVVFRDANGKEIARQKQRANDYGSFAGSFTAPRDRVMGQMSLMVQGRALGEAHFRVEEYKRPKFQVTLDAPKTAVRLNEKASLQGRAMSYTGAAVDGAQVKYRVVREVRMPWWWGWYGGWRGRGRGGEQQEIAHGAAKTEADGSFKIEFTALPDPQVPEKDEPTFVFRVTADVTDSAGETRLDERSIRVGFAALEATLAADDWQTDGKPIEIRVATRTLDDEPQTAEGNVKLYELEAPSTVQRPVVVEAYGEDGARKPDLSAPNSWPLGRVLAEKGFTTDTNGIATLSFSAGPGAYRAVIETQDRFGKKVTGKLPIKVLKPEDTRLALRVPHLLEAPKWEAQPGEEFRAVWGTGYESGRAFVEIEHHQKMIERFWTKPGQTQQQIRLAVTEALRGGFTLHIMQVRENRGHLVSRPVEVPWKNKELELSWEHFVSKLQPGQKETWTLKIKPGPYAGSAEKAAAELVATLYDESLDAFAGHNWLRRVEGFRRDFSIMQSQFANNSKGFWQGLGQWPRDYEPVEITYRSFPADLVANLWRYGYFGRARKGAMLAGFPSRGAVQENMMALSAPAPLAAVPASAGATRALSEERWLGQALDKAEAGAGGQAPGAPARPKPDLSKVSARKNLNETAFFYPQLISDSNGIVSLTFTMPEALTKWRFLGFAHDRALCSGFLEGHAVTVKDLMVQPNPPRFLREGDSIEFTVKVSNQSDKLQSGTVRLSFDDLLTGQPANKVLGVRPAGQALPTYGGGKLWHPSGLEQSFNIPAKQSRSFAWTVTVPDGCGFLSYKAVAAAGSMSDGEEGSVPVLARRILVTESLPLPIIGPATKGFQFTQLLNSGSSKTLRHQSLTAQMVSNPAWYAVLALPYLMEFPHECAEQVFNRVYANALARTIANSDPRIRRIFDQWKNTPALDSPLEKSQDLKSVALEETPWLRQAQAESQARRNVGILFDDNRLNAELEATLRKLGEMQLSDGSWPWFPGGNRNDYITLYIVTGFGRLRHLNADVDAAPGIRALNRLDAWMLERYQDIMHRPEPDKYVPSATDALYLYGRSFFLKDQPIGRASLRAVEFFLGQSRKFWLQTNCRQTQGHLALALGRFAAFNKTDDPTPKKIMNSIKERSVTNEELGRFWRDTEMSWWWYRAPIETQALMIEAFDEVLRDLPAVEECRVWLLKQKQTQDWKTTKATADAVYALLLRGRDILASDVLVELKLGNLDLTPKARVTDASQRPAAPAGPAGAKPQPAVEPGTGFYEVRIERSEIKPALGQITVHKPDKGVAWGSVHWQYLEDMAKVTPYEGTPLKLKKAIFVKAATSKGPVLEPIRAAAKVGDELVVRLELRVDRDMEYVHLKDQRGSGTEPVNVLSRYKYQDGLAYYESTRDTASHFFIDYLPKGTYVFEYSTRVQLRGAYQTGVAEIQCMYAPEFNSHSESIPLQVK